MRLNVSKFLLGKLLRPALLMVSTLLIVVPVVWVAAERQGKRPKSTDDQEAVPVQPPVAFTG